MADRAFLRSQAGVITGIVSADHGELSAILVEWALDDSTDMIISAPVAIARVSIFADTEIVLKQVVERQWLTVPAPSAPHCHRTKEEAANG